MAASTERYDSAQERYQALNADAKEQWVAFERQRKLVVEEGWPEDHPEVAKLGRLPSATRPSPTRRTRPAIAGCVRSARSPQRSPAAAATTSADPAIGWLLW